MLALAYLVVIILVFKSYTTRVGNGRLAFEMPFEEAQAKGYAEWGVVSGRKRRISEYLDFDKLRYSAMVNSANQVALTKIDIRFGAPIYPSAVQKMSLDAALTELTEKLRAAVVALGNEEK